MRIKTPINDYSSWIDIKNSAPTKKVEDLAKKILNLYHILRLIPSRKIELTTERISEALQLHNTITSDFLSLFKEAVEFLQKTDEVDLRKIDTDILSVKNKVDEATDQIILRPEDKQYSGHYYKLKTIFSELINTLIGCSLIEAWEKGGKTKENFYKVFYQECIWRSGLHPILQVFKKPMRTIARENLTEQERKDIALGFLQDSLSDSAPKKTAPLVDLSGLGEGDSEELGEDETT